MNAADLPRIRPPSSAELAAKRGLAFLNSLIEEEPTSTETRPDRRLRPNFLEGIPRAWCPFIEEEQMSSEAKAELSPNSGAELLNDVFNYIGRFVAYPSTDARVAHALWIGHAHLMDSWESTPRIAFLSPEPGSGKTRALEITATLVPRAVSSVNA